MEKIPVPVFYALILYWGYCIIQGGIGFFSHWNKPARDYFIADRSLPGWVFLLAATATSFSGWTFISHPGLIYKNGFPGGYASFYAIAIPFTGLFFLKRQWMLSQRCGFVTPGEMFCAYFNSESMRRLVVVVALAFSIPYLAIQLRASGFLFNILTDGKLSIDVGMYLLSAVVIIYVVLGGLRAVAYVDTLQAILIASGITTLGILVLYYAGGWCQLNTGITTLAQFDVQFNGKVTEVGHSHYVAIPGVIQSVSDRLSTTETTTGAVWNGLMILTFMLVLMGIQTSPAFSMWAFSNKEPKFFAHQQVWASSFFIGFILIVFTTIQGLGSHLLGADAAFREAHPNLVNNIMGVFLGDEDLMVHNAESKQDALVPLLIRLTGDIAPWLMGLLSVCALAAIQSTAASYMSTTGSMLSRDIFKNGFMPNIGDGLQKFFGGVGVILITGVALWVATTATDTLVFMGALAVAYGFQMLPALLAICWFPFFTRQGILSGLIVGLVVVTVTEGFGQEWLMWDRWPLILHSAFWGMLFNFTFAITISFLIKNKEGEEQERKHRDAYHLFLREHVGSSDSGYKKILKLLIAWGITLAWLFFAIGPGAFLGNTIFSNPFIPSIWAWQIFWWMWGVFMMWFLAYRMGLSTEPKNEITPLHQDISEVPVWSRDCSKI
ncbi:MAG: sodium:solute symporter family protein [Candidatus Parabeggiatoa sp. nov. 1]|nr:MAG: sodium:solute symporter family protein [Gammaproteobacteria bacterium]